MSIIGTNDLPLVSVIIPTFNNSPVVRQAVDCILDQNYPNCEIIVIDDGSTDNTETYLRALYEDKILYIRQENTGPAGARNRGIRLSSGKYIQFLDADDLLDREKISIQVKMMKNIRSPVVSYCDYKYQYMDGSPVKFKPLSPVLQHADPFDDLMMNWETSLTIPIHCFLFDSVFFKDNGIAFDETLPSNEDWNCWMDVLALQPTVLFVNRVLAFYRVRSESRCQNHDRMRSGYLSAIGKQRRKHRRNQMRAEKLRIREKEIRFLYRDASPIMKLLDKCPFSVKKLYIQYLPWRIQRLLD
jgi:glycosyltransferase involved in cell wall biosynthesis